MNFQQLGSGRRRFSAGSSLVAIAFLASNPAFAACTNGVGGTFCTGDTSGPVISYGQLQNSGTIDGGTGYGIYVAGYYDPIAGGTRGSVVNSGTIISNRDNGVATIDVSPSVFYLTNSGRIENRGAGITITVPTYLYMTNSVGSSIASGGPVALIGGRANITNQGVITGSVILSGTSSFDNLGGTVKGDLIFGRADDLLVVGIGSDGALVTGVTGRIDGGGGVNSLQAVVTSDVTLKNPVALPDNFTQFSADLANGATLMLDRNFDSSQAIAIKGDGTLVNEGRLTTQGTAIGLAGYGAQNNLGIVNKGVINATLTDPTQAAIFTPTAKRLENSGTINAIGGMAIQAGGGDPQTIVNSGTIASNGPLTIGLNDSQVKVENQAGGIITGPDKAIGYASDSYYSSSYVTSVSNAGRIDGDVDFTGRYAQNIFRQRLGSVVNGDIKLGDGDDIYVVETPDAQGLLAGLNGTLDGGEGFDRILARISNTSSITLGTLPIVGIEQVALDIAQDKSLTLTGTAGNLPLALTGKGTVHLNGDFSNGRSSVIDATAATFAIPGEPYNYTYDATSIVNEGTLTGSYDVAGYPYIGGVVRMDGGDSFTNKGTINLTSLYDGVSAISGGKTVINSGSILLNGGSGVSGAQSFTNDGVIRQVSGGGNAYGVSSITTFTNNGTISTGNAAVLLGGYSNSLMVNNGLIESINGAAIAHQGERLKIVNSANGIIRGTQSDLAITSMGGVTLENAGKIVGDVLLGIDSYYYYGYGNSYIAAGGTIEGDLRFGSGDDFLLVEGDKTGVSGTIDGGDGFDSYGRSYRTSGTVTLGAALPTSFEAESVEAVTADTILTLTGTPMAGGIVLYGSGKIINTATFTGIPVTYPATPYSPAVTLIQPATISLGGTLRADAVGELAFANQASGTFSIIGTARDFSNSGTIVSGGSTPYYYYYPTVGLTADDSRNFTFSNSGTISSPPQQNYFYSANAVNLYDGESETLFTATLANSGAINGGMSAYLYRSVVEMTNSGTITQSGLYVSALDLGNNGGTVSITNSGTIDAGTGSALSATSYVATVDTVPATASVSLVNRGMIRGNVYLEAALRVTHPDDSQTIIGGIVTVDNGGTIDGNVQLGQGDDHFTLRANGSVTGTVDGGIGSNLLTFELGGATAAPDFSRFFNFQSYAVTGSGLLSASLDLPFDTLGITNGSFTVAQGSTVQTRGAVTLSGGDGNETVVNNGLIRGAVDMGAGNDSFTDNGTVEGGIALGAGDDHYSGRYVATGAGVDGGTGIDRLSLGFTGTVQAPTLLNLAGYTGFEALDTTSGVTAVDGSLAFQTLMISGGRLIGYAGSAITAPRITVATGATFGSAGNVTGNIDVAGTLSPGASPGTMRVTGNVSLAATSTSLFELTPTINDQLLISGNLAIAGGATLSLTGTRPIMPGTTLDLIVADGGITGAFSTITQSSAFGFVRQTGNRIQLLGQFLNSGFTAQTSATIDYVNATLIAGNASAGLLTALPSLFTASGGTDGRAFALLNAEAYASASQLGISRGLTVAKVGRSSLSAPHADRGWFGFGQALGDWRKLDGNAATGVSGAKVNSHGVLGGIGFADGAMSMGAFIGYQDSDQHIGALGASTKADGVFGGVVSRYAQGGFSANLLLGYDGGSADTKRLLPGQRSASGHYKLASMIVDASLDYRLPLGSGWALVPQAGYSFLSTQRGSATENGGAPFGLAVRGRTTNAHFVDAALAVEAGAGAIRPWLSAGVRHQLSGKAPYAQAGFAGSPGSFRSLGVARSATLATAGAGVSAALSRNVTLFAAYQGEFGSDNSGHSGNVGVRIGF